MRQTKREPRHDSARNNGFSHTVQFYEQDEYLIEAVARFVGGGISAGEAVIVIATDNHRRKLEQRLQSRGLELSVASDQGRYVAFDAAATLDQFMVNGQPDPKRFDEVIGTALRRASACGARVHAFGEMVAILWGRGERDAAIRLEQLWNELGSSLPLSLLCAYPRSAFDRQGDASDFYRVGNEHDHTLPAEETRARLAAIVESSDDAIVGKNLEGIVTSWNRGAERIFGYTANEMIGQSILRIVPPDRSDDVRTILSTISSGKRVEHFESERVRKDGERIVVSLTVSPIRDSTGRIIGASKIARDVTERKREERAKDQFLAMLGHELRNPLSAVHNAITSATLDPGGSSRALEIARHGTHQLTRLVDDLLDVTRITRGLMTLRKCPIMFGDVVQRAIDSVHASFEENSVALTVSLPPRDLEIEADAARLEQVVGNLLANAAKYTEPGGRVTVTLDHVDGQAVLRVHDTGIGIAADLLPRVFDLFVQAEQGLERQRGGLGIGLTLVKQLVEMHGGQVEARSAGVGCGAEFIVRLPAVVRTCTVASTASTALPRADIDRRVLIVEDNADAAESMKMLLDLLGLRVRAVGDGIAALEAARANPPDVMLIDIGLPGMSGYELAELIRREEKLRSITLVALTGYGQEEDRQRALAAGFDYHLVKPVDFDKVESLVAGIPPSKHSIH